MGLVVTYLTVLILPMLAVGLDWTHWFVQPALIPAAVLACILGIDTRAATTGKMLAL